MTEYIAIIHNKERWEYVANLWRTLHDIEHMTQEQYHKYDYQVLPCDHHKTQEYKQITLF